MGLLAIKNTLEIPSWFLRVFLLIFTSLWILMPKNEVKLKENLLNFLSGKIHYCMKGLNHPETLIMLTQVILYGGLSNLKKKTIYR